MKTLAARYSVALIAAITLAPAIQAQVQSRATGGVGLSVWKDANFRGDNATFRDDVPDLARFNFRNAISSLRVPSGEYWEGCEQVNYGGRCQVFSASEPNLNANSWNDRIASIRKVNGDRRGDGRRGGPNGGPAGGPGGANDNGDIVLSANTNWRGASRTYSQAVPDLRQQGFDRRVLSLKVLRGSWDICQSPNYQNCRTVSGSIADLGTIGYAGGISSIRPSAVVGNGGGRSERSFEAATQACTTEVQRRGWTLASAGTPSRSGSVIAVPLQIRRNGRGRETAAQCTYDPRNTTAQIR